MRSTPLHHLVSKGSIDGPRGLRHLGRCPPTLAIRSCCLPTASVVLLSLLSGCPRPDPPPAVTLFLNFDGTTLQSLPSDSSPAMEDSSQNTVDFQMFPLGGYACLGDNPPPCCTPGASIPVPRYDLSSKDATYFYNRTREVAVLDIVCQMQTLLEPFNILVTTSRPATGPYTMGIFGLSAETACSPNPNDGGAGELGWAWGPPETLSPAPTFFVFGPDMQEALIPATAAHEFGHTLNLAHVVDGYQDIMQPDVGSQWGTTDVPLLSGSGTQNDTALISAIAPGQRNSNQNGGCDNLGGNEDINGYLLGSDFSWIAANNNPNLGDNGFPTLPSYQDFTYFYATALNTPEYVAVMTALSAKYTQGDTALGNNTVYANSTFGPIYWEVNAQILARSTTLVSQMPPPTMADPTPGSALASQGFLSKLTLIARQYYDTSSGQLLFLPGTAVGTVQWPDITTLEFADDTTANLAGANGGMLVVDTKNTPAAIQSHLMANNGTKIWFGGGSANDSPTITVVAWGPAQ
jgi:hypothetical protein